jgi:glycosyltransferase involved in cell wall biosynthesis
MRILLVNGHGADLAYGGTERYVHDLRVGLEARGYAVTVLSSFPTVADSSRDRRVLHDSDWRESRSRRLLTHTEGWLAPAPDRLGRLLDEVEPDLVHTSNLLGVGTGLWEQARRRGLPVVHTLHDYGLLCPRTSLLRRDATPCRPHPLLCGLRTRRLARWVAGVDAVIGVSAQVLRRHDAFFPAETARHVILSPLAPFPSGDRRARVPAGPALRSLGFLGTLSVEKGVDVLIQAATEFRAHGIRLLIAGDGPLRAVVQAAPAVDYLGPLLGDQLHRFILSCDAGIVPSVWEEPGVTFVALEWLAAGRPVISSGRGGLAELEPLGGVMRAAPTAAGLSAAAAELADAERYGALAATVPTVEGGEHVERWLESHLDVYADALRSGARARAVTAR